MKDIKEHVKEILEDTAHTVKGLRGKGRKVERRWARRWWRPGSRATPPFTRSSGT